MFPARFRLNLWPGVPRQPATAIRKEAEAPHSVTPIRNWGSLHARSCLAKAPYNSSQQQFRALAPGAISLTGLSRERQWENEASLPRPIQSSPKTFELAYCGKYLDKSQLDVRRGLGSDPFAAACVTANPPDTNENHAYKKASSSEVPVSWTAPPNASSQTFAANGAIAAFRKAMGVSPRCARKKMPGLAKGNLRSC